MEDLAHILKKQDTVQLRLINATLIIYLIHHGVHAISQTQNLTIVEILPSTEAFIVKEVMVFM